MHKPSSHLFEWLYLVNTKQWTHWFFDLQLHLLCVISRPETSFSSISLAFTNIALSSSSTVTRTTVSAGDKLYTVKYGYFRVRIRHGNGEERPHDSEYAMDYSQC
jgi:hypothetical protein